MFLRLFFHIAVLFMLLPLGAADNHIVLDDELKNSIPIAQVPQMMNAIEKTGIRGLREKLAGKSLPRGWWIDFRTASQGCDLGHDGNGFRIDSPNGVFKIYGPSRNISNNRWTVEIQLSLLSENTVAEVGISDAGLVCRKTVVFRKFTGTTGRISEKFSLSCLDGYDICTPVISVKGHAVIHRLRILRESVPGCTVVEGTIKTRSRLPAPEQTDYPDCYYTAHFIGNAIKSGKTAPRELALTIAGFKNKKTLYTDSIKDGDKIECVVLPFSQLPDDKQSVQQADDLQLFSLENYYVLSVHKLSAFSEDPRNPGSGTFFTDNDDNYVSIFRRAANAPIDRHRENDQAMRIHDDLTKTKAMLAEWSAPKRRDTAKSFKNEWEREKSKDAPGRNRKAINGGLFVWRKIGKAYFQLHQYYYDLLPEKEINRSNIEAIVNLRQALAANGVQLIISLIPDRNHITARIMNPAFRNVPDYQSLNACRQLLENGIEVISPWRELIDNFDEEELCFNLYADPHPSTLAQKTAARMLAQRLARYGLKKHFAQSDFDFIWSPANHFALHAVWPENCDIGEHKAGTSVMVRQPRLKGKPLAANRNSEILVVGDSFSETPYIKANALATWLAFFSGCSVDFHQFSGNGPETVFIRQLLRDPDKFLKNKKVLIIHTGMHALYSYSWLDIKQVDQSLKDLSQSRHIATFSPADAAADLKNIDTQTLERRKKLPSGTDYVVSGGPLHIAERDIEKNFRDKKLLCIVPTVLFRGEVTLVVNGVEKKLVPGYVYSQASYNNLVFPIPAGSTKIGIDARGSKNAYFILNDIEIRELKP